MEILAINFLNIMNIQVSLVLALSVISVILNIIKLELTKVYNNYSEIMENLFYTNKVFIYLN